MMSKTFYKGIFVIWGTSKDSDYPSCVVGGIYNLEKDAIARRDELLKKQDDYSWEIRIFSLEKPLDNNEYAVLEETLAENP